MRIYVSIVCQGCANDVHQLVLALDGHRGLPVVPADVVTETRFDCDHCGTLNYTGELPVTSVGPDVEDDDDE